MKKKKLSLNKLFQNNKFLIILALVISTITWVYMSMGTTNDTTVTISNIPIQIELPDQLDNNGLQVFRDAEQTATVTVTGSRAVLGSIGTKDITVTGATNGIDSAGTYQLSLSAVKANPSANFQIISTVTPSNVNVIVDYQRETSSRFRKMLFTRLPTDTMRQLPLHQRISQSQDLKQRLPKSQRFRHQPNLTVY
mgnify:CR=1 FL=1